MNSLSYAKLPDSFCQILKADGQGQNSIDEVFDRCYQKDIPFRLLSNKLFPEILKMKIKPERLGRSAIKEKLAASYMEKYRAGDSRDGTTDSLTISTSIQDIKKLEEAFSSFTVDGHSRTFMLGFYLKMTFLSNNSGNGQIPEQILSDLLTVIPLYLKMAKAKIWRIDFIALSLWYYHSFLGQEQLLTLLKRGINHADIFRKLKAEERAVLVSSLLTYGISIGETEPYYSPMLD